MRAHRFLKLAAAALVIVAAAGTVGATAVAPATAAGVPGSESPWWVKGVADPLYPHHVVYYDTAGGKWADMADAAAENNALKLRAANALPKAQAVPSSFWKKATDAAKAGTGKFTSAAQVMEQGNLTRYSRTAVIVAEKVATGAAPLAADAAAAVGQTAAKIPVFPPGALAKVGAAGAVIGAYQFGAMTGKLGLSAFGIDSEGLVCSNTGDDLGGKFVQAATGNNCGAFRAANAFVPNADALIKWSSGMSCNVSGTWCLSIGAGTGFKWVSPAGSTLYQHCFVRSGPSTTEYIRVTFQLSTGNSGSGDAYRNGAGDRCGNGAQVGLFAVSPGHITGFYVDGATPVFVPVTQQKENPDRTWKTTIRGTDWNDYFASTSKFKETDSLYPVPVMPILPDGVFPQEMTIEETGGETPGPVYAEPVDPAYGELVAAYPECGQGACMLDLLVNGESCFQGNSDCADWFTDPQKETKYGCKYGSHVQPLAECTVYADLFKPNGAAVSDPETGAPMPGVAPSTGGKPVMENGVAGSDEPRNCFPSGWAVLNPVEWVVRPVQCAMEWAFVPRKAIVGEVTTGFHNKWNASPPAQLATAIGGVLPAGGDDASCQGIAVDLSWIPLANVGTQYFLPACPGDFFAPIAPPFKILIGIGFIIAGFFGISRHVGGLFGYGGLGGEK